MSFQILAIVPASKKNYFEVHLRYSESRHFSTLILICNYSGLRRENVNFQKTLKYTSYYFFDPGIYLKLHIRAAFGKK